MVLNTGSVSWNKPFKAQLWAHEEEEGDQGTVNMDLS